MSAATRLISSTVSQIRFNRATSASELCKPRNAAPLFFLKSVRELCDQYHLLLMAHISFAPSETDQVIELMRPHDVVTRIYNPLGILDDDGNRVTLRWVSKICCIAFEQLMGCRSKGAASMRFLYEGFSQKGSVRCYRFQEVVTKERATGAPSNSEVMLNADISLMAHYHILLQDGPEFCMKILTAAATDGALQFRSYEVTREDASAFASAREAIQKAKAARRKPRRPPFKPSPSSQLRWVRKR